MNRDARGDAITNSSKLVGGSSEVGKLLVQHLVEMARQDREHDERLRDL
jgi:hypothetical protein